MVLLGRLLDLEVGHRNLGGREIVGFLTQNLMGVGAVVRRDTAEKNAQTSRRS